MPHDKSFDDPAQEKFDLGGASLGDGDAELKGEGVEQSDDDQILSAEEVMRMFGQTSEEEPSESKLKQEAPTPGAQSDGLAKGKEPDGEGAQDGASETEKGAGQKQELPTSPPSDPNAALRAELEAANRRLAELERRTAPQPQQPQQKQDPQAAVEQERKRLASIYNWTIPPAIAEALASENVSERQGALGELANSLGREVHLNVVTEMRDVLEQLVRSLPDVVNGLVNTHSRQQDVAQDLYGHHPDLNKPAIRRLVPAIAQEVMTRLGAREWSVPVREAVAVRIREELGLGGPQKAPQQAPTEPQQKPPAQFRNTGRAPGPSNASAQQRDIMQTFGL